MTINPKPYVCKKCNGKKDEGVIFLPNMRICKSCFKEVRKQYNKHFYQRHKEERKKLNQSVPEKKKLEYKINQMKRKIEKLEKRIQEIDTNAK